MLILARPLHAHRTADCPREDRGVGGGVFMTVHAVTSGALDVDEPYRFLRQAKEAREGFAIAMRTLGGGPHRRGIIGHIGDRAGWADRAVALHRPEITGAARHGGWRVGRMASLLVMGWGLVDYRPRFVRESATPHR